MFSSTKAVAPKRVYKRENSIRVTGFNPRYKEDDLAKVFEKAGRIRKIFIPKDFNTGANKNFAFIDFEQSMGMKNAIDMFNDAAVDECVLTVTSADQK